MKRLLLLALICAGCSADAWAFVARTVMLVDFSTGSAASNITYARTGEDLYAQTSATTVAKITAGNAAIENRGDGLGYLTWTFPTYTNGLTAPRLIGNGSWLQQGTGTVTADDITDPAGSTHGYKLKSSGGNPQFAAYEGAFAFTGPCRPSLWATAKSGDVPTAHGAVSVEAGSIGLNFSLSSPGTWARYTFMSNDQYFVVRPAGYTVPGGSVNAGATGSMNVWGAQFECSLPADVPLVDHAVDGVTGAATAQLASGLSSVLAPNGDLDLDGTLTTEYSATVDNSQATVLPSTATAFYATSANGETSLKASSNMQVWTFKVEGTDRLVAHWVPSDVVANVFYWRIIWKPSTGQSALLISSGGAWQATPYAVAGGTNPASYLTGSTTGGALATPTSVYFGSSAGATSMAGRWKSSTRHSGPLVLQPEIVIFGDSIGAYATDSSLGKYENPATLIYTPSEAITRSGIVSCARSGNKIADITTDADGLCKRYLENAHVILIQIGTNDLCAGARHDNVVIGDLQTFITHVKTLAPLAKIVISQITPAKSYYTANCNDSGHTFTRQQNVNTAIGGGTPTCFDAGGGCSAITGVDARITTLYAALSDGSDNCANCVDNLHPTNAGRQIEASYWRAGVVAAGGLP